MFKHNHVIADSLTDLGMHILAKDAIQQSNQVILQGYVKIITLKSMNLNRPDVMERLWSVGLAY